MTCPPCNHNCNEGRTCPTRNKKYIEEDDDIQEYKRPWVGLTDDEMYELWLSADEQKDRMAFGKAVEAKLKEKNT